MILSNVSTNRYDMVLDLVRLTNYLGETGHVNKINNSKTWHGYTKCQMRGIDNKCFGNKRRHQSPRMGTDKISGKYC